ncbi:MAG: hypothetical protein M1826_000569 [Phylliscum demangeonii]|nr:MAG: hypothetical protein M1826_000569 [Phylliscum demangeonii]
MAEVLSAPVPVEGPAYFPPARLPRSPSSIASFVVAAAESYAAESRSRTPPRPVEDADGVGRSAPPSVSSSPPTPDDPPLSPASSYLSTPASTIETASTCTDETDDADDADETIIFPAYHDAGLRHAPRHPAAAPSATAGRETASATPWPPPRPCSPDCPAIAEDDTAVQQEPSRHVDYLSHEWREEDLWSSWRHIVSRRKLYANSARLENASWRSWAQSKHRLRTVSPETLNWCVPPPGRTPCSRLRPTLLTAGRLKDCDVTWLYGPLQTHRGRSSRAGETPASSRRLSTSNSFLHKKPILKKRSMSEVMLQKSISSSSLLKQAAAVIQAQRSGYFARPLAKRPAVSRTTSDFAASLATSPSASGDESSPYPSTSSSGLQTPSHPERRHIHFNDKVEQCIAVDLAKDDDGDDDDERDRVVHDLSDDSDDGLVMKKVSSTATAKARRSQGGTPRSSFSADGKTIAMLPATTLKDQPAALAADARPDRSWHGGLLSPSASHETLRPSRPSSNFLLEDEDDDLDVAWEPSGAFAAAPERSAAGAGSHDASSRGGGEGADEPRGLRRTASGMFMPYDDDEDGSIPTGLLGKVVDTVNTAKDIAHVIWNVGWRR